MSLMFWILVALFFAGLWWFGRASEWKIECLCVEARREPAPGSHHGPPDGGRR